MAQTVCPQLIDVLASEDCLENLAGLGTDVYVGLKEDLEEPMTLTDNEYSTPVFKNGKGLYKVQCKDDSQQIQGSSLGYRKGFELTCNFVIDSVNKLASKLGRAVNNLDIFIIAVDGEESQIMYSPSRKIKFDSGAITSDTGTTPDSDRMTSFSAKLGPVPYPNLYVAAPEGGWDSKLANKPASA